MTCLFSASVRKCSGIYLRYQVACSLEWALGLGWGPGNHIAHSLLKWICDNKIEALAKFSPPVIRNILASSLGGHSFSASIVGFSGVFIQFQLWRSQRKLDARQEGGMAQEAMASLLYSSHGKQSNPVPAIRDTKKSYWTPTILGASK